MNDTKNVYYRGSLKTCNYSCSYCSFARKETIPETKEDKKELTHFYDWIKKSNSTMRLMFLPYGEALIHLYYQEAIIRFSQLDNIKGISCQTNLSFNTHSFIQRLKASHVDVSIIKLWASFHPEMVVIEEFVDKVHFLKEEGLELAVGVVGSKNNKNIIAELRQQLDPQLYLFINAIQRSRQRLDEEDIAFFSSIDPLFRFDYKNVKADFEICKGGKTTFFVNSKGDIYACPRSSHKGGNIYIDNEFKTFICNKKVCDCYITYSNMPSSLSEMMGEGSFFRIPTKRKIKAFFFDIDGTLISNHGEIPESYKNVLFLLRNKMPLFLATSLPLNHAKRRLGKLFQMFAGGVFADGGHIKYNDNDEYIPIATEPSIDETVYRITKYKYGGEVYKYAVTAPTTDKASLLLSQLDENLYQLYQENRLLTITNKSANKKNGVEAICNEQGVNLNEVAAIGNSMNDLPMLTSVGYPCAVLNAEKELFQYVKYILNPDHLLMFFN